MRNCDEITELLYQYLDRELSEEEYQQIRQHLDACPPCQHIFKLESNMLTLVGECCRRVCAPPTLIDRVRRLSHERIE